MINEGWKPKELFDMSPSELKLVIASYNWISKEKKKEMDKAKRKSKGGRTSRFR